MDRPSGRTLRNTGSITTSKVFRLRSLFTPTTAIATTRFRARSMSCVICRKDRPVKSLLCKEENISIFIDDRERYVLEVRVGLRRDS